MTIKTNAIKPTQSGERSVSVAGYQRAPAARKQIPTAHLPAQSRAAVPGNGAGLTPDAGQRPAAPALTKQVRVYRRGKQFTMMVSPSATPVEIARLARLHP